MKKIIIIFSAIITIFTGVLNGQQENMNLVRVTGRTETSCRVIIEITGEVKFHVFKVTNPPRLVVEMVDVVDTWSKKEIDVGGNIIKRIRSGQYKDKPVKIVRVVLDMAVEDYYYEEISTKNQIEIFTELPGKEHKKGKTRKRVDTKYTVMRKKLQPNIPTQEHKEDIARILKEKREREKEKAQRLKKISEIRKKVSPWEEEISISMFGASGKEPVDFNFKDADIREVLRGFAIKLNKNIIPAPGVSGKVNLRLKNVPFDEAFKMLLDRNDLVAIQKSSNVIEIVKKGEMPIQRKTFYLAKRNATEIQTTLQGLLTSKEKEGTTIAIDEASNSVIVTATTEVLGKIEILVRQLDIKSPQIMIKARLIEVNMVNEFSSSISMWNRYNDVDGKGLESIVQFKDEANYEFEDGVLKEITVAGEGAAIITTAVLNNVDLFGILNFLAANSKAKTISEPTILTENNKTANIRIGENLPVQTLTITEEGTTQTVTFIKEGIDLEVTPVVSPGSNQISLKVKVGVAEFTRFQAGTPVITERSVETEITIESGKTVIMGGLIKERVTVSDRGIPILKDIPLIGFLFKNKSKFSDRTELLVFLTPEILID